MVQHMILSMVVPLFCALGAPVTLALRTLPQRPRRLAARGAALPGGQGAHLPAAGVRAVRVSPWALYFTGWYTATLHSSVLHELMHVHLVLVGALFFMADRRASTPCPGGWATRSGC